MNETEKLIAGWIFAISMAIISGFLKTLRDKNKEYDEQILKFNEKYIGLKANIEAIEHNIKSDRRTVTDLFKIKFEQIEREYTEIKSDFKEIKADLKQLINERK
jgi:wobble nucleotide-excising tRNase